MMPFGCCLDRVDVQFNSKPVHISYVCLIFFSFIEEVGLKVPIK